MKNCFNLIKELAKDYNRNKDTIFGLMKNMDSFILEKYPEIDTERKSFFKETPEERLQNILLKIKQINDNPNIVLKETIKRIYEIMHNFIKNNSLGFISEFYVENGRIFIETTCLITSSTITTEETPEMQKEHQKKNLKRLGLEFCGDDNCDTVIKSSETNINILKELFESKGAKLFTTTLLLDKVHKFNFILSLNDVENFLSEKENVVAKDINGLTEVDLYNINKNIEELIHSAACYNSLGIASTCGYIIHHSFAELSKILKVETTILKNIESLNRKDIELNKEIMQKEEELAKKIPLSDIKNIAEQVSLKIGDIIFEKLGFMPSNIRIDRYGFISFQIKRPSQYMLKMYIASQKTTLSNEDFKTKYQVVEMEDNTYLIDNGNNKEKVETDLKEIFPKSEISQFVTGKEKSIYVIKEIFVKISDI